MTRSPNSGNRRFNLFLLSRIGMAVGAIALLAIIGGAWWVWVFINEQLTPLIERNLSELLGRPVEIGELERFSLDSVRFGSSSIPATATDPDRVAAEAVEVEYNLWQVLFDRTLALKVRLIEPDVYIVQSRDGCWVETEILTQDGGEDFINYRTGND